MYQSHHQRNKTTEPTFEVPQQTSARRSSWIVQTLGRLCLVVSLLYLGGFYFTANALAQCATCERGGRCAMNNDGTCMANRTFWGYYQGNWRKWPTVAAAEAAAANAPPKQSPSSLAPNSVLPSPETEARSTTPNISSPRTEAEKQESAGGPNENPSQRTPKTNLPGGTDPREPRVPQTDPAKDLFPNTKLPSVEEPADQPMPMPNPNSVRPALPGSLLDDPAPTPPVDPNDRVPNLPPNLKDLETDKQAPSLDDLFKSDGMDKPKPPGGASIPRVNQPAAIQQAATASDPADSQKQRRGRFANGVLGIKQAAANTPSAAGLVFDEIDALERSNGSPEKIASPGSPLESVKTTDEEPVSVESISTIEADEPELLLSPEDTTEVKNPLRDEVIRARYAARMFTPQTKAAAEGKDSTLTTDSVIDSDAELNSANPLRSALPSGRRSIHTVVPVAFEEPVQEELTKSATEPAQEVAKQKDEVRQATAEEAMKSKIESVSSEPSAFQQATPDASMLTPPSKELRRENASAPAAMQRKQRQEPKSNNALRAEPTWDRAKNQSNPLRAAEAARPAAGGKTLATGRYAAAVTPIGSARPTVAPTAESVPTRVSTPQQETFAPRPGNPLRSGF